MPGANDRNVLATAVAEQRILVTFDRDFGTLAFQQVLPVPEGIILLRFVPSTSAEPAAILVALLGDPGRAGPPRTGRLDRERVRQRSL